MDAIQSCNFDTETIMAKAIELALKAQYRTEPNPIVGAVLVDKNGNILSEGYHKKAGSPHAEVMALEKYTQVPEDATLFVTLEPCNFFGKTPPCTELILKKKVFRVVVGCKDPNPKVAGMGIQKLKDHGVKVSFGVCEERCRDINREFNKHIVQQLPYVTIKAAATLDGKIAMASGESKWITGEAARARGHLLRSQHQAMTVGRKTLELDNPRLTDRSSSEPRHPLRVIFSSTGSIPMDSWFIKNKDPKRFVLTGNTVNPNIVRQLEKEGVVVLVAAGEKPEIKWGLAELYQQGICTMLLEGGADLISSFIREKMADRLCLFLSSKIIGDPKAPAWCSHLDIKLLDQTPALSFDQVEKLGDDLMINAYF